MGGSSKKATSETPAATTPTQPMQTIQPSMPGQLEALAQQLSAGFGQSAPDMMSYLQQFYKPMQVPDYSPQPAATPTPAPAPAATGGVNRGGQPTPTNLASNMILNRQRGGGS
jgi:hypothetical protein